MLPYSLRSPSARLPASPTNNNNNISIEPYLPATSCSTGGDKCKLSRNQKCGNVEVNLDRRDPLKAQDKRWFGI